MLDVHDLLQRISSKQDSVASARYLLTTCICDDDASRDGSKEDEVVLRVQRGRPNCCCVVARPNPDTTMYTSEEGQLLDMKWNRSCVPEDVVSKQ